MPSQLSTHILTTHLLTNPSSSAVVIDTTGTFDILCLYSTILSRLRKHPALHAAQAASGQSGAGTGADEREQDERDLSDEAIEVLDRVEIMRAFDLEGVVEAVEEVREGLQGRTKAASAEEDTAQAKNPAPSTGQSGDRAGKRARIMRMESGIADSEDEEEEEYMLFGGTATVIAGPAEPIPEAIERGAHTEQVEAEKADRSVGMIIIDDITRVVSPLMKSNYVKGMYPRCP